MTRTAGVRWLTFRQRLPLLAVLFTAVLASSCRSEHGAAHADVVVDTIGSVVVVTNSGDGRWESDTVRARPLALIGEVEGLPEYMFGRVSGLAVDEHGSVFVSDEMASTVRVFGDDGRHALDIGRGGRGPGEFQRPTGPAFGPGGTLFVRDEAAIARFIESEDGAYRYHSSIPGIPYGYSLDRTRIDRAGNLHFPVSRGRITDRRWMYVVIDAAGTHGDTLPVPVSDRMPAPTAVYRTGPSGGRMLDGLSRAPFAPVPSWDMTRHGTLWSTAATEYEIVETDRAGDTLRIVRRSVPRREVPAGEHRDSARAVRQRLAEVPVPLDQVEGVAEEIRSGSLPDHLPQIAGIHAGEDGRMWVERWPVAGSAASVYDVFQEDGIMLGTVLVPARFAERPTPVFGSDRIYGVIVDPETDVQRVAIFGFSTP
jgi:hypothetical protein